MNLKFLKYISAFVSVVVILISMTAGGAWVFGGGRDRHGAAVLAMKPAAGLKIK